MRCLEAWDKNVKKKKKVFIPGYRATILEDNTVIIFIKNIHLILSRFFFFCPLVPPGIREMNENTELKCLGVSPAPEASRG